MKEVTVMNWNEDSKNEELWTALEGTEESSGNFQQPSGGARENSEKRGFKRMVSMVAAGVVGSALTLTALPYTGYLQNLNSSTPTKTQTSTAVTQDSTSTVTATQTSSAKTTTSGSVADKVESVSKAIVGIENYQQQTTNNSYYGNGSNYYGYGSSGNSGGSSSSTDDSEAAGTGSGIIFQKSGDTAYIVTNNHVVEGASKLEVSLYDGHTATATVVGTDALTDLAVIKIDSKYVTTTAQFGKSSTLRPGDQVYAIGNPLGLDLSRTVTSGIVSAVNRTITESTSAGDWDTNVIQTDAAINPGNSGGALINDQGLVMGINSSKIAETGVEGIGFAIPSDDAISVINQLIKEGKIERPYLGIGMEDLSQVPQTYWQGLPSSVTKGVMITAVDSQSIAASSGFQTKDVIVSMNGTTITSSSDLRKYLYTKVSIGDTVDFGLYRNGQLMHISVKLTATTGN